MFKVEGTGFDFFGVNVSCSFGINDTWAGLDENQNMEVSEKKGFRGSL